MAACSAQMGSISVTITRQPWPRSASAHPLPTSPKPHTTATLPPSSTMRSGPAPSGHTSASLVHHQYSSSVSPFHAKTAAPRGLVGVPPRPTATAAAAVSCVLKMLHEAQRTSAPRSISVSISTAVCTVMWSEPVMRAPPSGLVAAYRARSAMSPGISCSARRISRRPSSASARSFTLKRGRALRAGATDVSFVVVLIGPSSAPGGAPEPGGRAQVADAVGALPGEVRPLGDAPEVTVGGGALVDGALQPERADDGRGLQVEYLAHDGRDLLVGQGAAPEGVHQDGDRVRDADRVRDLHLAALRQLGRHDVLGDVAHHVGGAAVDLRGVLAAEGAAAVPPVATVGVDDDLPPGEAAVAPGPALDEAAGGVDVVDRRLVEEFGRDDLLHDLLDDRLLQRAVGDVGGVLRGDDHRVGAQRPPVAVLDRHLALAIGTEEGEEARAPRLAEPLPDAVRGVDGEGHVLAGLVAGVAEHHALVARALLLEEPLALGDALRDVERLPLDRRHDGAAVAVEAALGGGVADVADHLLRDLAELDPRTARDLPRYDHEPVVV